MLLRQNSFVEELLQKKQLLRKSQGELWSNAQKLKIIDFAVYRHTLGRLPVWR